MSYADSSGLYALSADIRHVGHEAIPHASAVVRKTLHDIEADAKQIAIIKDVVDTGDLINSISTEMDGDNLGGQVGPTVDYGIYQELGTSDQPARPYLGPAFDIHKGGFNQALLQVADGLVS